MDSLKVIFLVSALGVEPAAAATFDWVYDFDTGDTLTGVLEGTVGADLDTITVTAVNDVALDGTLFATSLPFISVTEAAGITATPAVVSFSGDLMDICADTNGNCAGIGFFFVTTVTNAALTTIPNGSPIGPEQPFDTSAWSITERVSAVPLPAAGWMLLAGVGALAARRGRKAV